MVKAERTELNSYYTEEKVRHDALQRREAWTEAWTKAEAYSFVKKKNAHMTPDEKNKLLSLEIELPGGVVLTAPDHVRTLLSLPFPNNEMGISSLTRHLRKSGFRPEEFYSDAEQKMQDIAHEFGMDVPQNLGSRVHIVGTNSFYNALMYHPSCNQTITNAIIHRTSPDVVVNPDTKDVFINFHQVVLDKEHIKRYYPRLLTKGISGLWRSLAYTKQIDSSSHAVRQGFAIAESSSPEEIDEISYINDAFCIYLTRQVLGDETVVDGFEQAQIEYMEEIRERRGMSPLINEFFQVQNEVIVFPSDSISVS